MANICMYKIKVKGTKQACYALVNMMPLYSCEKEYLNEEGTDEDFTLVFSGDCKWSVSSYTSPMTNPQPFTQEELDAVSDGDHWDKTLKDKSVLLDCEIFCNSKDIDDSCWAVYEHYNRGKVIHDECPKELHIKRGRDYDRDDDIVININGFGVSGYPGRCCKVKFESGSYYYEGNYEVGDIVYVEGAKKGEIGRVVETEDRTLYGGHFKIEKCVAHVNEFIEADVELIWKAYKPADRKAYLTRLGLEENTTKKKFLNLMNHRWTVFGEKNPDWEAFKNSIR